jgi:putative sigma-54 modulation protein
MIEPIDIVGQKFELDEDIKRYVRKKIGRLDRYLSRHARKSVKAEVKLRDVGKNHGNKYECEVILHLPNETVVAKDSTLNIFAAVDIVEVKLKNQLKKYKDMRTPRRSRIKEYMARRFSSSAEEAVE